MNLGIQQLLQNILAMKDSMEDQGRTPCEQKNGIVLELGGEKALQYNKHNLVKKQQTNKFTNTKTMLHQTFEG